MRVTTFDTTTGKLVKETIEKLGGENLKGLVMDLRDNPGGVVQSALEVASLFLEPEQLVFSIRGRSQKTQEARAKAGRAIQISGRRAHQRKERQRF